MNQVYFKNCLIVNFSGSGGGSSVKSNVFFTSVGKRSISINNANQREMSLVGNHPRSAQMRFQNGSLISLFFQIPRILQQPPQPATIIIISSLPLIMVMVHGEFTGRMAMMSGKIIQARNHLLFSQSR